MVNSRADQVNAEVISNKRIGAYNHMVFAVNELANHCRPGNFAAIAVGDAGSSMILRRAFAIYRASLRADGMGILELVVAPHGNGSRWLASRHTGDRVNIIAPLGTAFGIPTQPVHALLVGGGYGSAPLFALAEILKSRECRVDMVLGASTAGKIYAPLEGKRSVNSLTITTDDGSAGITGLVSDVLPALIVENEIDVIYSCGPMGMLEAITKISQEAGVIHQCSVEESMACGIGVCMTCVLPFEGDDGILRMVRTCIDGPVMDGNKVHWNRSREVPSEVWGEMSLNFTTSIARATFPNPIFTASGCAGYGKELVHFFPLSDLGAIVTKSIMVKPRSGRATPRMAETPSGMLNSIGLQGPGIDLFIENDIPWLREQGARIIVSIAGESIEDYAVLARTLRPISGISALEVNISCPNVENRGQVFACNPDTARDAIAAVRRNIGWELPIIAKLSPDVTDIALIAKSVIDAGADGLALINTLLGMVIDTEKMVPRLAGRTGGLSGPAIRPIAVRAIYQVRAALPDTPIVGMGGVASGRDAFELVLAGANAVSVGTAIFGNPLAPIYIKDELEEICLSHGFSSFEDAISYAHREDGE